MGQQPAPSTHAPHGAIHVPQCPRDMFAGALNRILEQPVPVYAQSDTVFRACLQLQKYLIEPISRPILADLHPAELQATHCLCTGEVNWADLLRIAQMLPRPRQPRFPQYASTGETRSGEFYHRSMCARPQRWRHKEHEGLSQSHSGPGHDHPGHRSGAPIQFLHAFSKCGSLRSSRQSQRSRQQ